MSKVTISSTTEYIIGSEVAGSDGVCGDLRRIIVDPVARAITHLVVEPRHRQGEGHLVPIGLADFTGNTIQLSCTTSDFQGLEHAEETHLVPGPGKLSYTEDEQRSLPIGGMAGGGGMAGLGPAPTVGGMGVGGMGSMAEDRFGRRSSPTTKSPQARFSSAAASRCTPPMAPSDASKD